MNNQNEFISRQVVDEAVRLEDWSISISEDGVCRLEGKAINHPRLGTGELTSSRLIVVSGLFAFTRNTVYRLGIPSVAYIRLLANRCQTYNPEFPLNCVLKKLWA